MCTAYLPTGCFKDVREQRIWTWKCYDFRALMSNLMSGPVMSVITRHHRYSVRASLICQPDPRPVLVRPC